MDKRELAQALKLSRAALSANSPIPGLDCYYFDNDNVVAYNSHLAIVSKLSSAFPYKGYVPGQPLVKLINEMGEDLSVGVDNDVLTIKSGSSKAKLKSISNTNPLFLKPEVDNKQTLPHSAMFVNGLKRCMLSLMGSKSLTPDQAGIHLSVSDGQCSLYSTNDITISTYTFKMAEAGEDPSIEDTEVLLPAAMCEQLTFLLDELLSCPDQFFITEDFIAATFPKVEVYCSFYAAPPKKSLQMRAQAYLADLQYGILPKMFDECLKRCEIVAGESSVVNLTYTSNSLTVASSTKGIGEVIEEFPFANEFAIEQGSINVDIRNLRRVLSDVAAIAFGPDYICLLGKDEHFQHIIPKKVV